MIPWEESYTEEQNRAYRDLERLSCDSMKDVLNFLNAYSRLAARSGRMWMSPELSDKLFQEASLSLYHQQGYRRSLLYKEPRTDYWGARQGTFYLHLSVGDA
ncbi:hypothetical protein OIU84_012445 [Salix udensis]|uniref:Uncharacterized protein n=1 Tax=Salix udensis TaxID=889485 RepID=A0AAD6NTN5_9ROSI|nr:hypothetical protein OIU84_012445 [Salix udensis]